MTIKSITMTVSHEKAMLAFGAKLAIACEQAAIIFLSGPLGAGKTTFTRGFLRGLGYQGHVKSPTYTIVESYPFTDRDVYHFDLYRIKDPEELLFIGIQDYFTDRAICLIEWPEQASALLPQADLTCYIKLDGSERHIELQSYSTKGQDILRRLSHD